MCEAVVKSSNYLIKNLLNKAQPQQMKILSIKSSPTPMCPSSSPAWTTNFHELIQAKVKRNKNLVSMALGKICLQCLLLPIIDLAVISHEKRARLAKRQESISKVEIAEN